MESFLWSVTLPPRCLQPLFLQPDSSLPKCSSFKLVKIHNDTDFWTIETYKTLKEVTMKAWHFWSWLVIFAASIVSGAVCFVNEQPVVAGGFGAFTFMWLGILWKHMVDTDRDNDKEKIQELGALFRKMEEGFCDTERMRTCIYLEQYSKELQQPKTLPAQETAV